MSNSVSRRELFKLAGLTAVACCLPLSAQQNSVAQNSKKREFSVTLKHKILEKGKMTRLWIPLPLFREYQYLTSDINFVGNYTKAYISNTKIPTLYAEFDKGEFDFQKNAQFAKEFETKSSKELLNAYENTLLNDLFAPCVRLYPTMSAFLEQGFFLSGSGSAVFKVGK